MFDLTKQWISKWRWNVYCLLYIFAKSILHCSSHCLLQKLQCFWRSGPTQPFSLEQGEYLEMCQPCITAPTAPGKLLWAGGQVTLKCHKPSLSRASGSTSHLTCLSITRFQPAAQCTQTHTATAHLPSVTWTWHCLTQHCHDKGDRD